MKALANFVGYQLVWFLLVRGAARGNLELPLLAGALFLIWQISTATYPIGELQLLLVAVLLGVAVDGVAAATGWLRYASPSPALPVLGAPAWILMLWACFATTIHRSLAVVQGRPWLAALLGGAGAPLAYWAAARGWQAVDTRGMPGLIWIALGWALALPLLAVLGQRWSGPQAWRATR